MARGETLSECIDKLRGEIRAAASPSQGQAARPGFIKLLQRTQRQLWKRHQWEFLKVRRDRVMEAGARYYSFFDDLTFERISLVEFKYNGLWRKLAYGIGAAQYNVLDPDDATVRQDPVQRWQQYESDQFEIWPLPATNGASGSNGVVRFNGIKSLSSFILDSDVSTLDSDLIVLYSAAELLAGNGQKDAAAKLQQANSLYSTLTGQTMKATEPFVLGGGEGPGDPDPNDRIHVLYTRAG